MTTLGKIMEKTESQESFLKVGDLIEFNDGTKILIGDATLYNEPTTCGFVGWDWDGVYCSKGIKNITNILVG